MIRNPDRQSIPGNPAGSEWAEWDYTTITSLTVPKSVYANEESVYVAGANPTGGGATEIMLDYLEIPNLITALQAAYLWGEKP